MLACFVLTVAASKRLIAKGVAALPEVKLAKEHGRLIIGNGTTNAYVAEELLGKDIDKTLYTAGVITGGRYCATSSTERLAPICFESGSVAKRPWGEILADFDQDDVFIKGANAIDTAGNAGILVADKNGGTVGKALGPVLARGGHFIIPVGLEKLIPSVPKAAQVMGIKRHDISLGLGSGMIVVSQGHVITELEALHILFGVQATLVSSGGVAGSEGAVGLVVEGNEHQIEDCMALINRIKGEPAIKEGHKRPCSPQCDSYCHWLK